MGYSILGLCVLLILSCFGCLGLCETGVPAENFIDWDDLRGPAGVRSLDMSKSRRLIVVAKDGSGDSRTVQGAVDKVPNWNDQRVKILIQPGVYREKVWIPLAKPYISFIAMNASGTVISWNSRASDVDQHGQAVGTYNSATFAIDADFFCAYGITFENSAPSASPGAKGQQAVALRVSGDKAVFYQCKILGSQDTLFDHYGRHYFYDCYIQGSIDFIFGRGRSLYQNCTLHAIASNYGAITASQRSSKSEDAGFSFVYCNLIGSGYLYLGRAWGRYATVIYSNCNFAGIVNPERWYDWGDPSRRRTVLFAEYNCTGKGANPVDRVTWGKLLNFEQVRPFIGRGFIDGHVWLKL